MKKYIAICFILCGLLSNITFAQDNNDEDEQTVNIVVDKMPSFPGGEKKFRQYIEQNIKYPKLAEQYGIQGRVIVSFIVEIDGSITNVEVMQSAAFILDEEAVRLIKAMPNWIPGEQEGKPVRVKYIFPIVFKL